jgi:O-antigen/teichoic acid export membrane protein
MLLNAGSLVGTTAVTSVLGFAYWWVAARQFPPQAVGLASASISAMMLLGTMCVLGLGTLLIGELPRQPGRAGALISAALILVGVVGGCSGVAFALIAPSISGDFQALKASVANIALFAVGVSLTAITLVLDQALIGLLRGGLQLWRNTLFAAIKLAALLVTGLWLSHKVGLTIYATWALGNVLSLIPLAGLAALKGEWSRSLYRPHWKWLCKLGPTALQHHILNLTLQAPSLILPVVVTMLLSATTNAWFYVSWMMASFVFVIPTALTTVLYATSSAQPTVLVSRMRLTVSLALVSSVLAAGLLLLDSRQILALFGHTYAEQAAWSLRMLGLGAFPLIIKSHYVAVWRIREQIARALLPIMIGGMLEVGTAALGAHLGGLSGLSLGWMAAVWLEGLFLFRTVYTAVCPEDVFPQGWRNR